MADIPQKRPGPRPEPFLSTEPPRPAPERPTPPAKGGPVETPLQRIPDLVWAPLTAGVAIIIVGLLAVASGRLWLFASLGPTLYMMTEMPQLKSSRLYNAVFGHIVGMIMGYVTVWIFSLGGEPSIFVAQTVTWRRVWAAGVALALNMAFNLLLRSPHPPSAATTLLIALGSFKPGDWWGIVVGVAVASALGELLRRLRPKPRRGVTITPEESWSGPDRSTSESAE